MRGYRAMQYNPADFESDGEAEAEEARPQTYYEAFPRPQVGPI